MTIYAGGEELHACPGDTVTIPGGLEHTVRNDTREVTFLPQFSPAGFERYFHEMSEPAEYLGLPPHPAPSDRARMVATAARYGCVVTAPDPEREGPRDGARSAHRSAGGLVEAASVLVRQRIGDGLLHRQRLPLRPRHHPFSRIEVGPRARGDAFPFGA